MQNSTIHRNTNGVSEYYANMRWTRGRRCRTTDDLIASLETVALDAGFDGWSSTRTPRRSIHRTWPQAREYLDNVMCSVWLRIRITDCLMFSSEIVVFDSFSSMEQSNISWHQIGRFIFLVISIRKEWIVFVCFHRCWLYCRNNQCIQQVTLVWGLAQLFLVEIMPLNN